MRGLWRRRSERRVGEWAVTYCRWSDGRVGEWAVTLVKRGKGWRMSCDVGEVTESLENENELWRRWSDWKLGEWAELHLRHSSFSNPSVALPTSQLILQPSVASPTSQLILQPFFRFSYVTGVSLTSPGEPPMPFCIQNYDDFSSFQLWCLSVCPFVPLFVCSLIT